MAIVASHRNRPLVVIEAPGKTKRLASLLRDNHILVDVWATRGHFRTNPTSLWPIAIDTDLRETSRTFDAKRVAELQGLAAGRIVIIATDPDHEGEVIARDVFESVEHIAKCVRRVYLHSLDRSGVGLAFGVTRPVQCHTALPGDARRIMDRWIGSAMSGPWHPVGRVFSALLGGMAAKTPMAGWVTLTLPAADGGRPFVAQVPLTAQTRAFWLACMEEARSLSAVVPIRTQREQSSALGYSGALAFAAGIHHQAGAA